MLRNAENKNSLYLRAGILTLIIVLAAFSRIWGTIPNFSPMGAITLFAAAYFTKKWQAFVIPMLATFASDLVLSGVKSDATYTLFYPGFYFQYIAYALIVVSGHAIFKKITVARVFGGAIASTLIFFLVSNFGTWYSMDMYTNNIAGLTMCYTKALEFLKWSVAGDLLFVPILFGAFELAQKQIPVLKPVKA